MIRPYFVRGTPKLPIIYFEKKYDYQRQGHMIGRKRSN